MKLAERACIALLIALGLLLAVSFLPIGSEKQEVSLEWMNDDVTGGKLSDDVKEQIAEAVFEKNAKISVIVESTADVSSAVRKSKGKVKGRAEIGSLKFVEVEIPVEKVAALAADDSVEKIYPVVTYYPMLDESVPLVNAKSFWDAGYDGSGVKVAVLDTGIDKAHPMLSGRVVAERDFSESGNANDNEGHGTHVAGIIAGKGAYSGVAPGAQLLNGKVISDSSGTGKTTWIIAAIDWAINNNADVISMSLGAPKQLDGAVNDAIANAVASGVVVVVSSGNCGSGCPSSTCGSFRGVTSPGSSPNAISVGAVDNAKQIACFSGGESIAGVGIKPDVVAPGVGVTSSVPGSGYESKDGTSMSAPHVSGAAALLLQKNPELGPADVRHALEATSTDLGVLGKDISYGYGIIDLKRALSFYSEIEFSVGFEKKVAPRDVQHIEVNISDDIQISGVSGNITKPDSSAAEFALNKIDANRYSYDYADTEITGDYAIELQVAYRPTLESSEGQGNQEKSVSYSNTFRVMHPEGVFGNIESISIAKEQFYSRNLTGSFGFRNYAARDAEVSVLLQLLRNASEGSISQEIRLPPAAIAAGAASTMVINGVLEVPAGNYTLKILADYGSGSVTNETAIMVIDDLHPEITSVSYRQEIFEKNPLQIMVELKEHNALLEASISVEDDAATPIPVNFTSKLLSQAGKEQEFAVTIYGLSVLDGAYRHLLTLGFCDEYGNCAYTNQLPLNVSGCTGKDLLVVKTYEEASAFEENAGANVCLSVLNRSLSNAPPASYLSNFDAVVWTTGRDLVNIGNDDAAALIAYYTGKGKVVVEGSDVAFRHGSDGLMRSVLRSELKTDLGFTVTSASNMSSLGINVTRQHPLVYGLASPLPFNATIDPFPDAVRPYNGSVELAEWSGLETKGSAIVAYESEDGAKKSLLLPFSMTALNGSDAKAIAISALEWLLEESTADITPLEIRNDALYPLIAGGAREVIVEGRQFTSSAIIGSNENLSAPPRVHVLIDGKSLSEGKSSSQSSAYNYSFSTALDAGEHTVTVIANSDFSIKEGNYANNIRDFSLTVYPELPDLTFGAMEYGYDNNSKQIIVKLNVSNLGGTGAASTVKAYIGGSEAASANFELLAGETKQLTLGLDSEKGVYSFRAILDIDGKVNEHNESNNELQKTLYLCSKETVLVVDDNDALFYSTAEPGSAGVFAGVLKENGYCVSLWNEAEQGTPPFEFAQGFQAMVWSAGDYFGNITNNADIELLGKYRNAMLLEGSDIAMDMESGLFMNLSGSLFSHDMMISDAELVMGNHSLTNGTGSIRINGSKSPYPDGVEAVNSEAVAGWQNGSAAITAARISGRKSAYYAFSVDAISDDSARERLILNTLEWLLEQPNKRPNLTLKVDAQEYPAGARIEMNESETREFSANASDPDGDSLSYAWLLNGTPVSVSENFTFAPGYNGSGDYNLTIAISDGQAEANAELLLGVVDSMECNPAKQAKPCQLQLGVCAGSSETCNTAGKWDGCSASIYRSYSSKYEDAEAACDGLDNDCDGAVDEGRVCNTAPVLRSVSELSINENEKESLTLTAADAESDALNFSSDELPEGASLSSSGAFTWTPSFEQAGTYSITINVSDGILSDSGEFVITVLNVNRLPSIGSFMPSSGKTLVVDEGRSMRFEVVASDPDGDRVVYRWRLDGTVVFWMSYYVYSPNYTDAGEHVISVSVYDRVGTDVSPGDSRELKVSVLDAVCVAGEVRPCDYQSGVCKGSVETCSNGKWHGCGSAEYGGSYQTVEKSCDSVDNDCDGGVDEPEDLFSQRPCSNDSVELLSCVNGSWVPISECLQDCGRLGEPCCLGNLCRIAYVCNYAANRCEISGYWGEPWE